MGVGPLAVAHLVDRQSGERERERERESNDHNRCVQILIFPILIKYKHST